MNVYAENCRNSKLPEVWGGLRTTRELQRCLKTRLGERGGEGEGETSEGRKSEEKPLWTYRMTRQENFKARNQKKNLKIMDTRHLGIYILKAQIVLVLWLN